MDARAESRVPRFVLAMRFAWAHWRRLWGEPPTGFVTALLRSLATAGIALVLVAVHQVTGALRSFNGAQEWLLLATVVLVLLLAARVAAAVQRWRLGNFDLDELVGNAQSIAVIAISFLARSAELVTPATSFIADMKRFLLAYVALVLQDCEELDELPRDQLQNLLTDNELSTLAASERNRSRATVIEMWMRCRVSDASFTGQPPLFPHAIQAMELHRSISALPMLYQNVANSWSNPPFWGFVTRHSPVAILGYLIVYAFVRIPSGHISVVLWVLVWAAVLFSVDVTAYRIENHHYRQDEHDGHLEQRLLSIQEAIDAAAYAYFHYHGAEDAWRRCSRSVQPQQRRTRRSPLPRWPSSIAPASPRHSPSSRGPGSPGSGNGVTKPSLKHLLDMITTSPSQTSAAGDQSTTTERQPLLGTTPVARYNLFLQADDAGTDEGDSDATEVDEHEDISRLPV